MRPISVENVDRDLRALCVDIGPRLAGTPAEAHAADYLAREFAAAGAAVTIETFPVQERHVTGENLEIVLDGEWRPFPCSLLSNTPGTDGRDIEAPVVFFDSNTEYQRPDLSFLRGKAVIHLGTHIESRDAYRRLMEARPAFILIVDVRYPGTVPLADGMFPAYTRALGAVPVMNVAYMDAWQWKVAGASAARLRVMGGMRASTSQNVIAEFAGSDPAAGIVFAGGHHDTQAACPGADDNATGSCGLVELARALADVPRRRALRLISFGAEEQLSVGSAVYVRRHRDEIESRGRLMFNLDGYGSHLGWTNLTCNGPDGLAGFLAPFFTRRGQWVRIISDMVPYADHFPFVAAGVPAAWLGRENCTAGRFFHHRPDDDMSRVSVPLVASLLGSVAEALATAVSAEPLPFPIRMGAGTAAAAEQMWEDLFGGWKDA